MHNNNMHTDKSGEDSWNSAYFCDTRLTSADRSTYFQLIISIRCIRFLDAMISLLLGCNNFTLDSFF